MLYFAIGVAQSPNYPPDMPQQSGTAPTVPDLFSRKFGLGHLNVSVTDFPIGSCQAGLGVSGPA
jgi:hypothetical protein